MQWCCFRGRGCDCAGLVEEVLYCYCSVAIVFGASSLRLWIGGVIWRSLMLPVFNIQIAPNITKYRSFSIPSFSRLFFTVAHALNPSYVSQPLALGPLYPKL